MVTIVACTSIFMVMVLGLLRKEVSTLQPNSVWHVLYLGYESIPHAIKPMMFNSTYVLVSKMHTTMREYGRYIS